ncbi:MAG: nuclear transport factor 2 family protein [Sedimentitalea sp.]
MSDFQSEKKVVRDYFTALEQSDPSDLHKVQARFVAPNALWRGYHPFHEIADPSAVITQFWQPLRHALSALQRRMDVFMAGRNEIDGFQSVWVCSMGHLMGLFDAPWLGIAPTGKLAMLRYCDFHRVENGQIVETAMFFDIPHLMMQAGLQPFAPQTGAAMVQPGPRTQDGMLFEAQPPHEGTATLGAINRMISDLGNWDNSLSLEEELALSWHDDMAWWGPAGIGATYTIERYAKQHSGPFRAGFKDRVFNGHICRMAEGRYGGFFGWPNLTLTPTGGFMGMPAGRPGDMRVIDIYRRDGDKLAENWVFIDLLHFWNQQGVDVLARMQQLPR